MTPFANSYLGKLRQLVGRRRLFVPGCRVIVANSRGEVLLIRRTDNGKWGLPGGSPDDGDSMDACIRREVREETGLEVISYECFGHASDPAHERFTYPNGDEIHSYATLIAVTEWRGTPTVSDDEAAEVRFFSLDALPPASDRLANESRTIDGYVRFRSGAGFQWL